ncbi:MAG TPA: hypothetical protein PKD56_03635, partial [Chitinophagales bacterium]|nr:hypothetical protein [Chitinophagales bacterium]
EAKDVQLIGKISEEGKAIEGLDPMFEIVVKKYKEHCTFKAKVKILKPEVSFVIPIDGMSCNDRECVPFRDEEVELKLAASKSADTPPDPILNTNKLITPPANSG